MKHLQHSNAITAARRPQDTALWVFFLAGASIAYMACATHSEYMERVRIREQLLQPDEITRTSHSPGLPPGAFSEAEGRRLVSTVQSLGEGTDPRSPTFAKGSGAGPEQSGRTQPNLSRAQWVPGAPIPPSSVVKRSLTTEISVYATRYHGRRTASGARYDHYRGLTAATSMRGRKPLLPFGSRWEVEHKGRRIVVTITDTGSYKPRRARYWLDLSGEAWRQLTNGAKPSRFVAQMRRRK